MNRRLEQFLAAENISQSEFADTIGVARASVSHILAGRNKPSYDFIIGMMTHYPRLNTEWLLAGKGKMYKDPLAVRPEQPEEEPAEQEPDLFSVSPQEEPIAVPQADIPANTPFPEGIPPQQKEVQPIDSQRKIAKIIVFYNDNTFEELS